ncbi:TetR/AcrR family transcriptional regulator [Actinomadura montaniterrae]|uniref:TetR/AcrR family transcriptional regulator n=1 Tax=Actinomadura montaniterrae TaxID=1803903 RepID=A0A6L3VBU2_9ACTN|nr:TetR/AcrR family transcriptional regulator [Actinomadura montaniterrae]KAB2353296.1 TetR/AcrR family transcriptional regulator [Actinomadura montaniterrae]
MPRITAPTVAEHRARRHTALQAAARDILLADGAQAVTPASVGARAGLARSSVYKYYSSTGDILAQLAADVFADWTGRLRAATDAAATDVGGGDGAAARIAAYVRGHLEFARSDDRRVTDAIAAAGLPAECLDWVAAQQRALVAPLREALADRGDPDPEATAALILGTLDGAARLIDAGRDPAAVTDAALAFITRP